MKYKQAWEGWEEQEEKVLQKKFQKKMLEKLYHRKEKLKGLYCQCVKHYYKKDGDVVHYIQKTKRIKRQS